MSMLKIVCHDQTYRLCDVGAITEWHHFTLPKDVEEKDILYHAWKDVDPKLVPRQYSVTSFAPEERHGIVLIVDREHHTPCESEWWIVPARQCFLVSNDGKTIDRI